MLNDIKICFENNKLVAFIYVRNMEESEQIAKFSNCTCEISELTDMTYIEAGLSYIVKWYSTDAIDLLAHLDDSYYNTTLNTQLHGQLECNFTKSRIDAVSPQKAHGSDSGYDLTLLEVVKQVGDVFFFTTGIKVAPPHGYYFDLVPRSSISKTGYMLANSVGIIDQNYRGDIIVPLRKIDSNAESLKLPCKLVQLIPRAWHHFVMNHVENLDETMRGSDGFGSTS